MGPVAEPGCVQPCVGDEVRVQERWGRKGGLRLEPDLEAEWK